MAQAADNRCPVCRAALWAPQREPISHKTCPRCGAELWAIVGNEPLFFPRRPGETERGFLAALAGPLYGTPASELETVLATADALDLIEFVVELEDALKRTASGAAQRDV